LPSARAFLEAMIDPQRASGDAAGRTAPAKRAG